MAFAAVAIVGVVPFVLERDSFPLSDYPMFSHPRSTTESVDTAVLVEIGGTVRRLSPTQISGNDEVIIAAVNVTDAIRNGNANELCDEIASRLDDGGTVEVVTEVFDALEWYEGRRTPLARTVHAMCEVPR
jgi:hypothetical protein